MSDFVPGWEALKIPLPFAKVNAAAGDWLTGCVPLLWVIIFIAAAVIVTAIIIMQIIKIYF
jgi:hypothetical protein